MRRRFFLLLLLGLINETSLAEASPVPLNLPTSYVQPISEELKPFFQLSEGQREELLKGNVISVGNASTPAPKQQKMELFAAGVHPRNCTRALRKMSQYENYQHYLDFVKESSYDEKNQKLAFTVDHALLPFAMIVSFKIPRITKEGHYPFLFETGFLQGLTGTVVVKEVGKFCLLAVKSDWQGPDSPLPNLIFGTFVQTVGKIGLERLIRMSLF